MKFGHYVDTPAKNLREYNRMTGKGYCPQCNANSVTTVYLHYYLNCFQDGKKRAYADKCEKCGCTFGEPFKIYYNCD